PAGRRRRELVGQVPPPAAGPQDVDDGQKARPVVGPRPPALGPRGRRRQQRADPGPEPVGEVPFGLLRWPGGPPDRRHGPYHGAVTSTRVLQPVLVTNRFSSRGPPVNSGRSGGL